MSIRAKMRCDSKEPVNSGDRFEGYRVIMYPVVSGSVENEEFYRYTPGGECRLEILNEAASDQFEVGAEYYVTFEKAS